MVLSSHGAATAKDHSQAANGASARMGVNPQQPGGHHSSQKAPQWATMPHEPSGLPANGSTHPKLKVLQNTTAAPSAAPHHAKQQVQRPQNGAAGPAKAAARAPTSGAAPGRVMSNAAAPGKQPKQRAGQQAAVPTPAARGAAAAAAATPPAMQSVAVPAAAAQHAVPALANPGEQAIADLEALLKRLSDLDAQGWFRHPVRQCDAPNYHKIIRRPMCFEVMRGKIRGRQYVSWQEVVRDFDLICNNAMKYNTRRSRVHKQALVMQRAGKKLLAEMETEGRQAVAALVASGILAAAAAPRSVQLAPADTQAVPSSLFRSGAAGATPTSAGMLRTLSTADTATSEADSDMMQLDGGAGGEAEGDVDPAGYSSYEETDLEDEQGQQQQAAPGHTKQQQQLLEYARDAVMVQQWGDGAALALAGAAHAHAAQPSGQPGEQQQAQQGQVQQGQVQQQPGAGQAFHSREWKQVRRGVEWQARWLEHRLAELGHQRQRYQQLLAAEKQREAAAQDAPQQQGQQQQQQGQQQQQQPQQPQRQQQGGEAAAADGAKAEQGAAEPAVQPRLYVRHQPLDLPEFQLPGLLQHPFIAQQSVVGAARQQAAAAASEPAAMDCDDFPAEAHAALDLLEQRLSSLRRQLVVLQQGGGSAMQRMGSMRGAPGYRGGVNGMRRGSFTPRSSGGFTPRGTPRSSSFFRSDSLGKRRRLHDFDSIELVTPLGAPKFVERPQVKTIDTPRVRTLPGSELKRRQEAVEAYGAELKQGDGKAAAAAAIDEMCPGEGSSDEDTSDEAFMARHKHMEVAERARYESVLGTAVKKNKLASKVTKERTKHSTQPRPNVSRTLSAPALVGNFGGGGGGNNSTMLASPGSAVLPGAASAPVQALAGAASGALAAVAAGSSKAGAAASSAAATPSTAGIAAAAPSPASASAGPGAQQAAAGSQVQGQAAAVAGKAAGQNGLPLVFPMNAAMAQMAQQMVAAAVAANAAGKQQANAGGKQGGGGGGGNANAAAAAVASSAAMMRPPFTLTPAMAAAMAAAGNGQLAAAAQQAAVRQAGAAMAAAAAAAADQYNSLQPALQGIMPNGPTANGGAGGTVKRGRGRPRRNP